MGKARSIAHGIVVAAPSDRSLAANADRLGWHDTVATPVAAGREAPRAPSKHRARAVSPASRNTALRETSRTFESLYGSSSLAALILDEEAQVVYANAALLDATGWSADEVFGTPWFDRFLEQPCDPVRSAFRRVLADDPLVAVYTIDVLKREGGRRRIRWHNALVRADDRVIATASVGEFVDVGRTAVVRPGSASLAKAMEIIAISRALVEEPEENAMPFVRLIAEHCAQLAEDGDEGHAGAEAAERIRRMFQLSSSD